MGNTVPPRMCREAGTAVTGRRHPKRMDASKERQEDADEVTRAGRRRGIGGGEEAATVVTVKIVLKRKDAEELVARLNAQSARERKARMTEIKWELRAGDGGGASPAPAACRDAWRPRLAPIAEN